MGKTPQMVMAEIAALRKRVAEQYPSADDAHALPLADLLPLFHARDAAGGKVAAIGKVNPRPPGAVNALIQFTKKQVARTLNWFVRDQVEFNEAAVRAITDTLEALNAVNRTLVAAGARIQALEQADPLEHVRPELRTATDALSAQTRAVAAEVAALDACWEARYRDAAALEREAAASLAAQAEALQQERVRSEERSAALAASLSALETDSARRDEEQKREEIRVLKTLADVQNAFMQRMALLETELRASLETRAAASQQQAVALAREELSRGLVRLESQIHDEVRVLRQRVGSILARESLAAGGSSASMSAADPLLLAASAVAPPDGYFDSLRFSERFRGSEEEVCEKLRIYVPRFLDQGPVLDLGCGRGEFLGLLRDAEVECIGVESSPELVRLLHARGLPGVEADLFDYLGAQAPASAGGIFCAHVIEHMPPEALARLVALAYRTLRPGGLLVFETPNPACLAIFATYFFLDPTHIRPVPSELVCYLLEEAGFQQIEVAGLHPAEGDFASL
ncbi:MAG: class I SAM-dependent methyltransferase, partial [Bryobacterales bacterium]|nr:class I SAM-dependent methyltransferase [Bryobacterales bacterium]